MLLIDGALAAFNGALVAGYQFWCECVLGGVCCAGICRCGEGECCDEEWRTDEGECCGNEWRTDEGFCCAGQWFQAGNECPEGSTYFEVISGAFRCCFCLSNVLVDAGQGPDDIQYCCDESGPYPADEFGDCRKRCCDGLNCLMKFPRECEHTSLEGSCVQGCPASCCTEGARGTSQCETVDNLVCEGIVDPEPCESACKGACCIDGELVGSPKTQTECDDLGGCWKGAGSTECVEGLCREPFVDRLDPLSNILCCETVTSSAAKLTFTGPGRRRCPDYDTCGFSATVTVATSQRIYVHGGLFGSPYETCTDEKVILLCNDELHVTPAPCSGSLQGVNIEVCWNDAWEGGELASERLFFRCCQDTTHLLGNCECDCHTIVLYEDTGCTSNAQFVMRGRATIDASGGGALVLTEDITQELDCERTLTLTGSSTHDNTLSGAIDDGPGTSVDKKGVGLWRLSAASGYSGRLRVIDGTLVIATNVPGTGFSPFGTATGVDDLPRVGGDDLVLLLAEGGVTISRGFRVVAGTGVVVLGMTGPSGTATFGTSSTTIRLGRDVTLSASTGGEAVFASAWKDLGGGNSPAVAFDIGRAENLGTVVLKAFLPDSITIVNVYPGAVTKLDGGKETIYHETPVVLGAGSTLDLNGTDQPLDSLTLNGRNTTVTGGTLTLSNSTVKVDYPADAHEIESAVTLDGPATFGVPSPASLTISGSTSGVGGIVKTGNGTLTLEGDITYTGQTSIAGGTLIVKKEFAGSADISFVKFTPTTLEVAFAVTPTSAATYKLLGGSTLQTYGPGAVTLTGAGGATGTYNSSTSTLTID